MYKSCSLYKKVYFKTPLGQKTFLSVVSTVNTSYTLMKLEMSQRPLLKCKLLFSF